MVRIAEDAISDQARHTPSWLARVGSQLDRFQVARTERYARASTEKPGYGVLDIGDALVRYRMHGTGPSIVFSVDPPVVLEQYDDLVAQLANDHCVIVMESPGFGFSSLRRSASLSFDAVGEGLAKFLHGLARAPYTLAFSCVPGYGAIYVANRHPELVSRLVLSQVPSWEQALIWKRALDPHGVLSTPIAGQLALRVARRKTAAQWLRYAAGSRACAHALCAGADHAFDHGAGFALASVFQSYLRGPAPVLPALVETLFIWGLRDRSHASTVRASSRLLAPRSQLLEAPNLGHFPELEDPKWFAEAVRSFARADTAT